MEQAKELAERYAVLIKKHHDAMRSNDFRQANAYFTEAEFCIAQLKQLYDWETYLLKLLSHQDACVRINSAGLLLPYRTKLAKLTLVKHCFLRGINGFHAKMILKQWNAGELKFPVLEDGKIVYR